jgi:hypothetical protein
MTNVVAYQGQTGRRPPNSFSLTLDFKKPPLIDGSNPVSSPTANDSELVIEGDQDAWVVCISEAVMGILSKRKKRELLPGTFVYDLGLMLFGFPLGIYFCWRSHSLIDSGFAKYSALISSGFYIYIFIIGIWIYRILFGYSRWAFPTVELQGKDSHSGKHRYVWGAIVLGIVGEAIYDIVKSFIT